MTLMRPHLFLFPLPTLVGMMLRGILSEALDSAGTPESLARLLRWRVEVVKRMLRRECPPEISGPEALLIGAADIHGKTPFRARQSIEEGVVRSLGEIGSNRHIARILQVGEWKIRRIKKRIRRSQEDAPLSEAA